MTGIVEWLRKAPSNEWNGAMLNKAADEIERLRAALDEARRDALEEVLSACHSNDGEVWRETILKLKDRTP
jgi:hypothetical protein